MAGRALPGIGLTGDWALGEDNWKDAMDLNLLALSVLVQCRVLSIVSATPGSPAEGAVHYFDGSHPTEANKIAAYDEGAWRYFPAFEGLELYNLGDDTRYVFDGTALVEMGGGSSAMVVETEAGATYSLVAADAGKHKRFTNAGGCVVTVSSGEFTAGQRVRMTAAGAGDVTLDDDGATVTLNSRDDALTSAGQFAVFEIECVASNEFDVLGDLIA